MPELRKDPVTGRWVIISTERGRRPSSYKKYAQEQKGDFCPFCEGNEQHTPPELLAYRSNGAGPNSPGWSLRVVPNKYPALQIEGDLNREGEGMFDKMSGIGAHEVIVESPRHEATLSQLTSQELSDVFWAFRERVSDLKRDRRFRYIVLFKNQGEAAGATLEHTHSQLIALPIVPKMASEELNGSKLYFNYKEQCIFCDIISQEQDEISRVIEENSSFIAIAPFAPRFPFETWILPKEHSPLFETSSRQQFDQLASLFRLVLRKMDSALEVPPYNFVIHSSPFYDNVQEYYHWHLELMPKLTNVAGFESGTGFYINPTSPEDAARYLREASLM